MVSLTYAMLSSRFENCGCHLTSSHQMDIRFNEAFFSTIFW